MTEQKEFVRKRRYPKDVVARMGNEIYEDKIRPLMEDGNEGKIVAIDVHTENYEVGYYWQMLECTDRLFDQNPEAQIWCLRIGYDSVHRMPWRHMTNATPIKWIESD